MTLFIVLMILLAIAIVALTIGNMGPSRTVVYDRRRPRMVERYDDVDDQEVVEVVRPRRRVVRREYLD